MDKYLLIIFAPLLASALMAFAGKVLGNVLSVVITIALVGISFVLSTQVLFEQLLWGHETLNTNIYTWLSVGEFSLYIGILIDELTAIMMAVVTFISLLVHIYSIGYMKGEEHYRLFFSYISLFTFAMLILVMSNNFLQLFIGWEAVGLVSYLLIGFYYSKESAVNASLKAFLVNRVGDFGFILGIALIYVFAGSLDYIEVFDVLGTIHTYSVLGVDLITVIALLLFIGAMGKSAQFPLHIWLPGSMEGPTPISALIHAATMVTAGIFMISRLSPLYELSEFALLVIMIIGGITALFMGIIGLVQTDIKKVIAYSTISQLGYMTVALGLGVYHVAIFHLFTHAFFKALLFLGAGSVIIALHHEQNIMKMGGLYKKMPITFATFLIATLAIIGFPGLSGFYSKELIIEATKYADIPYASTMYYVLLTGVLITTLYSMRLLILVFLGTPRDAQLYEHAKEHSWAITLPLILLAIGSVVAGFVMVEPIMLGDIFATSIVTTATMSALSSHFESALAMMLHAVHTKAFYAMFVGIVLSWVLFIYAPHIATILHTRLRYIRVVLSNLYYIDVITDVVVVKLSFLISKLLAWVDLYIIDKILVDGTSSIAKLLGKVFKVTQTGYVYHYGFFMIMSLLIMLTWIFVVA